MQMFESKDKPDWKALIEKQRQSGASVKKWCKQNQIKSSAFYYWQDKLFPKQLQKNSFTELNMRRPNAISLQARGVYIRIGNDCDPNWRKQLLTLFAGAAC